VAQITIDYASQFKRLGERLALDLGAGPAHSRAGPALRRARRAGRAGGTQPRCSFEDTGLKQRGLEPRRNPLSARSNVGPAREEGMAQFSKTVDIKRPPEEVWRVLGQPERWFEGYLETSSRSPEYPGPDTRNDHLYRTRVREDVEVRVTRSEAPTLLEETQQGKTFARRLRYSLRPAPDGTLLRLEDNIVFKGLGKLAAPIASRDVRNRWATSLERLKAVVEAGE
jgi:uncharacterized protein YndB with AHSA1/START domain